MDHATWLPHPVYTTYEVSDDGRVRSIGRYVQTRWSGQTWRDGVTLKTFLRAGGYLGGNICVNGQRINFEVHRFVCEAFHGLATEVQQVRHLDGVKIHNVPANLIWGTASENMQDLVRHGAHHEARKTHCQHGHPYDDANTYRTPGAPRKRRCRICDRATDTRRKQRRREAKAG